MHIFLRVVAVEVRVVSRARDVDVRVAALDLAQHPMVYLWCAPTHSIVESGQPIMPPVEESKWT